MATREVLYAHTLVLAHADHDVTGDVRHHLLGMDMAAVVGIEGAEEGLEGGEAHLGGTRIGAIHLHVVVHAHPTDEDTAGCLQGADLPAMREAGLASAEGGQDHQATQTVLTAVRAVGRTAHGLGRTIHARARGLVRTLLTQETHAA